MTASVFNSSTTLSSTLPPSTPSTSFSQHSRRSFSLFNVALNKHRVSEYAADDMYAQTFVETERPARNKAESKLYAFFHRSSSRSRSRSRPRHDRSLSTDSPPPPVPLQQHPPTSKPHTRSPSRPLSSTTANTHSTITSLPPTLSRRPKRSRPAAIAVLAPPPLPPSPQPVPPAEPPHELKLQSSARRKLQHLFAGARRASFGAPKSPSSASIALPTTPLQQVFELTPTPRDDREREKARFWRPSRRNSASDPLPLPASYLPPSPPISPTVPYASPSSLPATAPILMPQPRPAFAVPQIVHTPPTPARPSTAPPEKGKGKEKEREKAPERLARERTGMGWGRAEREHLTGLPNGNGNGNGIAGSSATGAVTKKAKKSRHGSFDFERPVSATTALRNGDTPRHARPLEKKTSTATTRRARNISPASTTAATTATSRPRPPDPAPLTPHHTGSSGGTAVSSSWGRAAGNKRAARVFAHGAFAFEPPVPVPVPMPEEGGTRTGRKSNRGRSLDLGLGLSWAPTRVKEEAMMPSFRRAASVTRSERSARGEREREGAETALRRVLGEVGFAKFQKYMRRFDAHTLPFDGPSGLVARVENLLDTSAPRLAPQERRELIDRFVQGVLRSA